MRRGTVRGQSITLCQTLRGFFLTTFIGLRALEGLSGLERRTFSSLDNDDDVGSVREEEIALLEGTTRDELRAERASERGIAATWELLALWEEVVDKVFEVLLRPQGHREEPLHTWVAPCDEVHLAFQARTESAPELLTAEVVVQASTANNGD